MRQKRIELEESLGLGFDVWRQQRGRGKPDLYKVHAELLSREDAWSLTWKDNAINPGLNGSLYLHYAVLLMNPNKIFAIQFYKEKITLNYNFLLEFIFR